MNTRDDVQTSAGPDAGRLHEHAWSTESAHRTSLGLLRYVRCGGCGTRRVDLQTHGDAPPAAISRTLPGPAPREPDRAGQCLTTEIMSRSPAVGR